MAGTDAASFQALYDQVKGGAFLEAVQKMKGLGAMSDKESQAASSAVTRMQSAQSEDEFIKASKEFRTAIQSRKGRVMAKAGTPGFSGSSNKGGTMATHDQYDTLPSGAEFTDPEGNVRRKP